MKLRHVPLLFVPALVFPLLASGTGGAEPVLPATPFHVHRTASSLEVAIDDGTFAMDGNHLVILSGDGRVLSTLPLSFRLADFLFPISVKIDGGTAVITPSLDVAQAFYRPVTGPVDQGAAQDRLNGELAAGAGIGLLVGTTTGAVGGCLLGGGIGAILGGLSTVLGTAIIGLGGLGVVLIPVGAIVGCGGGALTGGIIGGAAGAALGAGGGAIYFYTTPPPPPAPEPGPGRIAAGP
ncbi:hypothetical protein [Nocardia sp. NPDC005978]|uniref:hypothetical protein n=1 Tax=unclassified Nocardia TaxID=2637762 RepID=UPI0033B297D6